MKVERAKLEDFDELMSFLGHVFFPGKHCRLEREYCHIFDRTRCDLHNMLIIRSPRGRIVSTVGLFPIKLAVGNKSLHVGGIGGVATRPQYRGQGLMSHLLREAIAVMGEEGYDVSILWGDRRRYGNFGWEVGGRRYDYILYNRCVGDGKVDVSPASARGGGVDVRRFDGSLKDLRRIAEAYEGEVLRVQRSIDDYKKLFSRLGYKTWIGEREGGFAYATLRGEGKKRALVEYGGNVDLLAQLVRYLFKRCRLNKLCVAGPAIPTRYNQMLMKYSSGWSLVPIGEIKIVNLRSTLEKLSTQLTRRVRESGFEGKFTLEMVETCPCTERSRSGRRRSSQRVTLHFDGGARLSNPPARRAAGGRAGKGLGRRVSLSDRDMVKLIFGPFPPSHSLGSSLKFLDCVFPLDFYLSELNHV